MSVEVRETTVDVNISSNGNLYVETRTAIVKPEIYINNKSAIDTKRFEQLKNSTLIVVWIVAAIGACTQGATQIISAVNRGSIDGVVQGLEFIGLGAFCFNRAMKNQNTLDLVNKQFEKILLTFDFDKEA